MSHTSRKTGGLYHGDNKKKKGAERAYSDSEEKDKSPVRRPQKKH